MEYFIRLVKILEYQQNVLSVRQNNSFLLKQLNVIVQLSVHLSLFIGPFW